VFGDARPHLSWKSITSSAHYVTAKIFLASKFSYLLFPNPPLKLKLALQKGWKLLIGTHLDQSNYLANQQEVLDFAVQFTSLIKLCKNVVPKPFCSAKPACFDFSSSNFNLQGHILSTNAAGLSVQCW
jgi:hypothetical protein